MALESHTRVNLCTWNPSGCIQDERPTMTEEHKVQQSCGSSGWLSLVCKWQNRIVMLEDQLWQAVRATLGGRAWHSLLHLPYGSPVSCSKTVKNSMLCSFIGYGNRIHANATEKYQKLAVEMFMMQ